MSSISNQIHSHSNSVSGSDNNEEVNNLLVNNDCVVSGTLYGNVAITVPGTSTGAVLLRSSTGLLAASDNFLYNTTTNQLTTPQALITGSTQIGSSASNNLIVNSTSVFNNDVTIGSAGAILDTCSINSTSTFNNNVQFGRAVYGGDTLTCNSKFNADAGIRFATTQTYDKFYARTQTTDLTGTVVMFTPSGFFTSIPNATVSCIVNETSKRVCWIQSTIYSAGSARFTCKVVDSNNDAVANVPINIICIGD